MKFAIAVLLFGTAVVLGLAPRTALAAHYPSPTDWRNENIYQILTDRFYDGNPANNNVESSHGSSYDPSNNSGIHGGDFRGIQAKLDYVKALGATAIWISPIPLNVGGTSAYHGYGAQDFYTLAPHWGTMTDLTNMIQAAHARGIKVILDIVVNHTGRLLTSSDSNYPNFLAPPAGYNLQYINSANQPAFPFNPANVSPPAFSTLFHTNGNIGNFNSTQQVVLGQLNGLNDLATETTYVRTNLMNIYTNWVGLADFDGFRIDTAIEVDYGFWQYWCPQLHQYGATIGKSNFFTFGEAFNSSDSYVGSFTGTEGGGAFKMDSMLDYPLYELLNSVFGKANGSTAQIQSHYTAIPADYDSNSWYRLVTFLDNHDNARFLSSGDANGDTNHLTVALQFLYTARGIPCLYYGTEQAFAGDNNNNDNREDMFAGQWEPDVASVGDNFNETQPLFQQVARLNNFRRLYPALRTGAHNNLASSPGGPGLFAYSRVLNNQEVFVCFNTAASSQVLTNCPTTYSPGTVLVNLLNTNDTIVVTSNGLTNTTPVVTVPSMATKIYLSQSLLLPLDPVVISQTPSHAATNVPTAAPIVLQFSKPMNTNSVQAAFSVTPTKTGTFSWNTLRNTMTFTPGTAWASFATTLVDVATNAVDSVNSNSFYAPFDTYFVTSSSLVGLPTNLTATTTGTNQINLAWNAATGASGYVVKRGGSQIAVTVATSYSDLNLAVGTTYCYTVAGTNNSGAGSADSSPACATTQPATSATNLLAWWTFDEGAGTTIHDSSGHTNTGAAVLGNGVWTSGMINGALSFDGTTTQVTVSNSASLNPVAGITVAAWINSPDWFNTPRILEKGLSFNQYGLCITNTGQLQFYVSGVTNGSLVATPPSAGSWHHVAGTYDGTSLTLYIDGQLVAQQAASGPLAVTTDGLAIGNRPGGNLLYKSDATIDDVRIYGSGLFPSQIAQLYNTDSVGDGIANWWRLQYFGNSSATGATSCAACDVFGSGQDNFFKYVAGLDPSDPISVFQLQIASVTNQPSQENLLFNPYATGRTYTPQYSTDLVSGAWLPVPGYTGPVTNANQITITDTNPVGPTQFYRIHISLP